MAKRYWTKEETEWLIGNYTMYGMKRSAEHLGMTTTMIDHKIGNLRKHGALLHYNPILEDSMKCSTCDLIQPFTNFYKSPKGRNGLHSSCKSCFNKRDRTRYKSDSTFRLFRLIRRRFKRCFDSKKFSENTEIILGCSPKECSDHIESQFEKNMNWNNYAEWEIDHIVPISILKKYPDKMHLIFNHKNLQPLWKKENNSKGDNLVIAKFYLERKIERFGINAIYSELLDMLK